MIEVQGLTKRFGTRTAIEDVSFRAAKGEVLGFLGPNGAGKTTTLRILAGVIPPTAGRATIAGHDTVADGLAARRAVGYLPERVPLYDEMTVGAFLRFAAAMKGLEGAEAARAVARVAEETNLAGALAEVNGRLSRGYRQRVGLAQALLGDPPVLLLDEPTAGLDPQQIVETRALVRRLAGDRTVLLSTHILPEVSATCARVIIIARGRIVAIDAPAALAARLGGGQRVEVAVEGDGARAEAALRATPGVRAVQALGSGRFAVAVEPAAPDPRPQIAVALVSAGERLLEMRSADRTLEEVFLDLVLDERAGEHAADRGGVRSEGAA
jgi:ABC-2 type transport system ATP-binding protein